MDKTCREISLLDEEERVSDTLALRISVYTAEPAPAPAPPLPRDVVRLCVAGRPLVERNEGGHGLKMQGAELDH